jgi:hypothetical protein
MLTGCGDDGSPRPVLSLTLDIDSTGVEVCGELEITAAVENGSPTEVDWYVNGILGGDEYSGVILQNNPATYLAPAVVPEPPTLTIRAVSREDTTRVDSCLVTVEFTMVHVNAATGNDVTATGCATKPFKTITGALEAAGSGMTILVAPGIYDEANGEVFPLILGAGMALVGENWETTILRGHTDTEGGKYYSSIWVDRAGASIRKMTVEQGPAGANGWNVAIYVTHLSADVTIDSVRIHEYANFSVIRFNGNDNGLMSNCVCEVPGAPHAARGIELVAGGEGTVIRNCTFSGYSTGIFVNYEGAPRIECCTLEDNHYGVYLWYEEPSSNPIPDLGGGARGSAGGNTIRNNVRYGIYNPTTNTIYARYNTWYVYPPVVGAAYGSDIYNNGTGSVIW